MRQHAETRVYMKALRNIISASLVLGTLLIAGCGGDKHIAEVKAIPFIYPSENVQDPNMTVDQALDYRKICDSAKWTSSLSDQHQVLIEYRCGYKGVEDSAFIANAMAKSSSSSSPDMVGDIYQWTYGADGKPQLNYVAMQVHFASGKAWDLTHSDTVNGMSIDGVAWETALMKVAVDNTAEDYDHFQSQLYGSPIPQKPEASHPIHETASGGSNSDANQRQPAQQTLAQQAAPGGLTASTYGNAIASYYPGKSIEDADYAALEAIHSELSINDISGTGYPNYTVECEANGQCVGGTGTPMGSVTDVAGQMFSVNPADIGQNGIHCNQYLCMDGQDDVIGRNPSFPN